MATTLSQAEAPLRQFLEAAGRSLSDAQRTLGAGGEDASSMLLSSAELEVKAAVRTDTKGTMALQPISLSEISRKFDSGLLSTFRLQFVAVQPEPVSKPPVPPKRSVDGVVTEFRRTEDIKRLEKIIGALEVEAEFVSSRRVWLVTARDARGQVVREVIVSDEVKETRRG